MFSIPLTNTLRLELGQEHHASELFAVIDKNRAELRQWLGWVDATQNASDTLETIKQHLLQFATRDGLLCVIIMHNHIVGCIWLHRVDHLAHNAHIGYWLAPEGRGKGAITLACKGIIEFCFTCWNLNKVYINCAIENTASCAVPERLGFVREGLLREGQWLYDHFVDLYKYGLLKREWKPE